MRVDGFIYANDKLLKDILKDKAIEQVVNVAFLPGIVGKSMAMPDMHWGYGFPIGGVAATDLNNGGVISPGGVGFDINCGVRCMQTSFEYSEIKDHIQTLIKVLFRKVPSGVGSTSDLRLKKEDEKKVLKSGARWAVQRGFGVESDLDATEDYGAMEGADPDAVSDRAYSRGRDQLGTLKGLGEYFIRAERLGIGKILLATTYLIERDLVRQRLRTHPRTRTIRKKMHIDKLRVFYELLRRLDIVIGLARKTDDDIRRKRKIGVGSTTAVDRRPIVVAPIIPVHRTQDRIGRISDRHSGSPSGSKSDTLSRSDSRPASVNKT